MFVKAFWKLFLIFFKKLLPFRNFNAIIGVQIILRKVFDMTIKDKIRERRLELGLTLEEVANAVGVAKSTVKKWESGQIASMRQSKIVALARVLRVEPTYLIFEGDAPATNHGINNGIVGNHNSNNVIQIGTETLGEVELELVSLCKKMSIKDKTKLLSYAYKLVEEDN